MHLIGHDGIQRELRALALSAEPSHALLFVGSEGTGRELLATFYAQVLNCEAGPGSAGPPAGAGLFDPELLPCGDCRSCRLFEAGTHPDLVRLAPGDVLCKPRATDSSHAAHPLSRDIRICQVRGLIEVAARFPFEARYRLVVIEPAERLVPAAANALLKTIEEPPGHTIFALVTSAPEAIIETVVSRCRRIDVPPVARATIEAGLAARGIAPGLAAEAAVAAHGRPGRAIQFAADPGRMGDRERQLEKFGHIAATGLGERLRYAEELTERFRRERTAASDELDTWEAFWETRLREAAGAEDPDLRKRRSRDALEALQAVVQCRADLLANVQPRGAFELLLVSFPRHRLDVPAQEEAVLHG